MAWNHSHITVDGVPALAFIDHRYRDRAPLDRWPCLAWFGIWCPAGNGLMGVHPDGNDRIEGIERTLLYLCRQCGFEHLAYVHALFTADLRQYYFYHSESAGVERVLPELTRVHSNHRIEHRRIHDPNWMQYRRWLAWFDELAADQH